MVVPLLGVSVKSSVKKVSKRKKKASTCKKKKPTRRRTRVPSLGKNRPSRKVVPVGQNRHRQKVDSSVESDLVFRMSKLAVKEKGAAMCTRTPNRADMLLGLFRAGFYVVIKGQRYDMAYVRNELHDDEEKIRWMCHTYSFMVSIDLLKHVVDRTYNIGGVHKHRAGHAGRGWGQSQRRKMGGAHRQRRHAHGTVGRR